MTTKKYPYTFKCFGSNKFRTIYLSTEIVNHFNINIMDTQLSTLIKFGTHLTHIIKLADGNHIIDNKSHLYKIKVKENRGSFINIPVGVIVPVTCGGGHHASFLDDSVYCPTCNVVV